MTETCKTCRHFRPSPDCSNLGHCHRYPPVLALGSTVAAFPIVSIDFSCGEHCQANSAPQHVATALASAPSQPVAESPAALVSVTPEARERVFDLIRSTAPTTACQVASRLVMSVALIEQAADELEREGKVRRWVDQTTFGDGRTFLGLASPGLDEPTLAEDPTAPPVGIDPRTLLALVRGNSKTEGPKRWAKILRVSAPEVWLQAEYLVRLGHVKIRQPDTVAALVPIQPSWNFN